MMAICETYWYEGDKKQPIRFKWDRKGLIIGKINIKVGNRKKREVE
jgi:hypothetical protein